MCGIVGCILKEDKDVAPILFDCISKFNVSFILMANPDGVELVKNGILSVPEKYRENVKDFRKI